MTSALRRVSHGGICAGRNKLKILTAEDAESARGAMKNVAVVRYSRHIARERTQ